MNDTTYEEKLKAEADLWGDEFAQLAQSAPPDWRCYRDLRHNVIMHTADVDELLTHIKPGMRALELGCATGWISLAMAQQGAVVTGSDLSEKALSIARHYYESIKDQVAGSVEYHAADMNAIQLPENTYDVIVVKSVLHHLINLDHTITEIHKALKPGGILWASDTDGDEAASTVIIAGGLCLVLPTATSYADKLQALLKFGVRAPSRVKASIQAEGLSPFEGAGREHDWIKLIERQFTIEKRVDAPAFTGYVTAQLKAPDWFALPLLKTFRWIDQRLVNRKLLHNTGVILYARKK
ncbi:MAG: methyltransferase domain-containing protein [Anaerolineaceae bacterium]|nr:methyltransferase domain-containing protein [Anaerolineaceae bacterium]